jgi:hypothetical protein
VPSFPTQTPSLQRFLPFCSGHCSSPDASVTFSTAAGAAARASIQMTLIRPALDVSFRFGVPQTYTKNHFVAITNIYLSTSMHAEHHIVAGKWKHESRWNGA